MTEIDFISKWKWIVPEDLWHEFETDLDELQASTYSRASDDGYAEGYDAAWYEYERNP